MWTLPYATFEISDKLTDPVIDCVKSGRIWEPEMMTFCEGVVKLGTVVVDIGANIGTYTIRLSQLVGEFGSVCAFEPQPLVFKTLQRNIELNECQNVQAFQIALGKKEEIGKMKICGNIGSSHIAADGTEGVTVKTLDSFGLDNVSFIKIDVEGYEPYVFEGAKETIIRNRPTIMWEWGQPSYPEHPHDFVFKFLESLEYKCIEHFGPWDSCWMPAAIV